MHENYTIGDLKIYSYMLFEKNKEKIKKNEEIIFEQNREMIENRLGTVFENLILFMRMTKIPLNLEND